MALATAALLLSAATVGLDLRNGGGVPAAAELDAGWAAVLSGLAQTIPGLLLLNRLPRHPIAWILTISGLLWIVDGFASSWAAYAIYTNPRTARRRSGVLVLLPFRRRAAARAAAADPAVPGRPAGDCAVLALAVHRAAWR